MASFPRLSQRLRVLIRHPAYSLVVVLSLALVIAANVFIFSVYASAFLRPLPVHQPERLVRIYLSYQDGIRWGTLSWPDLRSLEAASSEVVDLVAERIVRHDLGFQSGAESAYGSMVTADYFDVLGVEALLGQTFSEDRVASAPLVVVLAHALWERRFGGDQGVVGRSLRIDGRPFTVLGVMPPEFKGTNVGFGPGFWVPLEADRLLDPTSPFEHGRNMRNLLVVGRIRGDARTADVAAVLSRTAAELAKTYPETNEKTDITVIAAGEGNVHPMYRDQARAALALISILLVFALVVVCTNLGLLNLARTYHRRHEVGVRLALGQERGGLVLHLLAESAMLALVGGGLGLLLSGWALRAFPALLERTSLPLSVDLSIDGPVLLATAVAVGLAALLLGTAPALLTLRRDLVKVIQIGTVTPRHRRSYLRAAFISGQVALATLLLVVSGLLLRGTLRAEQTDLGFDPSGVVAADVKLDAAVVQTGRNASVLQVLSERLEQRPEIAAFAFAIRMPIDLFQAQQQLAAGERPATAESRHVDFNVVSPDYFALLDIPVIQGRSFTAADTAEAPAVTVVNEALAEALWPGRSAVGERLSSANGTSTVVGVVGVTKYVSIGESPRPYVYVPMLRDVPASFSVLASGPGSVGQTARALEQEMRRLEPRLRAANSRTLDRHLESFLLPQRLVSRGLVGLAMVSLFLSLVGLFGAMTFSLSQRGREIGIRFALGADARKLRRMFLREGLSLAAGGLLVGIVLAVFVGHLLRSLLFGLNPLDPLTVGVIGLLILAATAVTLTICLDKTLRIEAAWLLGERL